MDFSKDDWHPAKIANFVRNTAERLQKRSTSTTNSHSCSSGDANPKIKIKKI